MLQNYRGAVVKHQDYPRAWVGGAVILAVGVLGLTPRLAPAQDGVARPETQALDDTERVNHEPVNPEETKKAINRARQIQKMILDTDGQKGTYSEAMLTDLRSFYRWGPGDQEHPGDPEVTRRFCRDYVLAQLWDLFLVEVTPEGTPNPDPKGVQNPLNEESDKRFRGLLAELLKTAPEDLALAQRTVLYRLLGEVLCPDDQAFLELKRLPSREDLSMSERDLVLYTIEWIEDRAESDKVS